MPDSLFLLAKIAQANEAPVASPDPESISNTTEEA
jgi:hypothetical protein